MRRKIRIIAYAMLYYIGIIKLFYWFNRKKQRILVFHHIIPDSQFNGSFEQKIVCTPKSKFVWLTELVKRRFYITNEIGIQGSVVFTFDDGYRAALVAADVLRTENAKAIIFIPIEAVNGEGLWIDRIMGWFAYVPEGQYQINGLMFYLSTQVKRQASFSYLIDTLYQAEKYNPTQIIEQLENIYPFDCLPIDPQYRLLRFKGLTDVEIKSLKEDGFKFGGHSVRHDILSCLTEEELRKDFEQCTKYIGTLFNTDVYAYPFGHKRDVNQSVIRCAEDSFFKYAVMNEYLDNPSSSKMSRINISHYDNKFEVEAALSGFIPFVKKITGWIK